MLSHGKRFLSESIKEPCEYRKLEKGLEPNLNQLLRDCTRGENTGFSDQSRDEVGRLDGTMSA